MTKTDLIHDNLSSTIDGCVHLSVVCVCVSFYLIIMIAVQCDLNASSHCSDTDLNFYRNCLCCERKQMSLKVN